MKRSIFIIFIILSITTLTSCEELFSQGLDTQAFKKLRTENTNLKIQIDKLQRQIKTNSGDVTTKNIIISLYDLRHAVEKYALENKGNYPEAENISDLTKVIKNNLPKDFIIESSYLETIKSSTKGYIFIANINDQKVVVSNLI
ncbi:MAG: hypothetical protein H7263_05650 [Candidatus Sericytochromatia bacterium]|nr:hypothetical protein [Candidatus Sericytochromatia bacterium]